MEGSYYSFPYLILSIGKDCKTLQRYPYAPTTSRRISLRSMDSFQRLTPKTPSSWHRSLAPRWNDPVVSEEANRDYENPDLEQLLRVMECKVGTLMKNAISLMGRSEGVFRMTSNEMYQLPPEPSRQEEFRHIVTNFIFDREDRVKQLEEYMEVIMGYFMQLSSEVTKRLKEKIIEEGSEMRKIEKITREIPNFDELEPQLLRNFSPLDVNIGDKRGTDPPIKPHSPDSFRMKEVIFDEKKLGNS
ncbi:hypothetical protein Tco_0215968 [Tanacetum coccineum]